MKHGERGYLDENGQWHPLSEGGPVPHAHGAEFFEKVVDAVDESGLASTTLIIRSQASPEFQIDLKSLSRGGEARTSRGKGQDWLMRAIKPEIELTVMGRKQIVAPWGRPTKDYTALISVGVGVLIGLAGYGAYELWRGRR